MPVRQRARGARPVVAVEADKAFSQLALFMQDREGLEVVCMDEEGPLPSSQRMDIEFS